MSKKDKGKRLNKAQIEEEVKQTKEEVKQTKEENRIGPPYTTITLDTCIYRQYGYRFDSRLLAEIKDPKIEVAVTEVVYREVMKHLAEKKMNYLMPYNLQ